LVNSPDLQCGRKNGAGQGAIPVQSAHFTPRSRTLVAVDHSNKQTAHTGLSPRSSGAPLDHQRRREGCRSGEQHGQRQRRHAVLQRHGRLGGAGSVGSRRMKSATAFLLLACMTQAAQKVTSRIMEYREYLE
jgi:hypothetical protein